MTCVIEVHRNRGGNAISASVLIAVNATARGARDVTWIEDENGRTVAAIVPAHAVDSAAVGLDMTVPSQPEQMRLPSSMSEETSMSAVEARFFISGYQRRAYDPEATEVTLNAVSRGDHNKTWARATPSGEIKMTIKNGSAASWFVDKLGQEVAVHFELAARDG